MLVPLTTVPISLNAWKALVAVPSATRTRRRPFFLMQCLQPPALKREIYLRYSYDESIEKNVKKFISMLVQEAVNCNVYGSDAKESTRHSKESKDTKGPKKNTKNEKKSSKKPPVRKKNGCAFGMRSKASVIFYATARNILRTVKPVYFKNIVVRTRTPRSARPTTRRPTLPVLSLHLSLVNIIAQTFALTRVQTTRSWTSKCS